MSIISEHLERVHLAVLRRGSMSTLCKWIKDNTFIGGRPFNFVDHEYQEAIITDTSQEVNVRKCSQVGVSEVSARLVLAMVNVVRPFTAIYVLPTAIFARTFAKTRFDPIISGSKVIKENVDSINNGSELKQFGDSFLYIRGAASSNAPISIPADAIISDETDFSDQETLTQYTSRLTHSSWKILRRFSTPTIPGYGIDLAFRTSRRFFNLCKCNHCNHWFNPSYFDHVKIPGYSSPLGDITKQILGRIEWQKAALLCPKCGQIPSLQVEHRQYVCENPEDKYVAAGYQVSPFDAPNIIKVSELVKVSGDYARKQDFANFALGLPMEDKEATLSREDLEGLFVESGSVSGAYYVMGVDVGNTYHMEVAAVFPDGISIIVHAERVPMGQARERYHQLRRQYRVVCSVIDSLPHSETVMALQAEDPNLFAAVYVKSKTVVTHTVVDKEKDPDLAIEYVRQVNINRNKALDAYMDAIRARSILICNSDEREHIIAHHTSMKRIKMFDHDTGEMSFNWQKTDGNDHYHHTGLYTWVAGKIRGVSRPTVQLPIFSISKFRLKEKI